MSLSHRVTEILEGVRDLTFSAFKMMPIPATLKTATNLITVDDTATGTEIVASNASRIKLIIQNQDSQPILLSFGENTSISNYSIVLSGASGIRTGDGGTYTAENWKGQIKGITETGSSVISIFEEVVA